MDLAKVNVWIDVVFSALYLVIIVALPIHFLISIPKGRFRKKWIEGKWPEHDEPHPPAAPKIAHFTHLFFMFVLGFTGMYIRFPFFDGGRTAMRGIHYFSMIVVVLVLIWRLWYAFFSKRRDWREFAITMKDVRSTPGVLLYYSFISDKKPHTAKYNVMQKMAYDMFLGMMLLQAFTGFSLLTQPILFGASPRYVLLNWTIAPLVGGSVALAGAYMRVLHYILTWLFIVLTTIHVYLSATEDIPVTKDFFGFGDHAEEHGEEHGEEHHGDVVKPVKAPAPALAESE